MPAISAQPDKIKTFQELEEILNRRRKDGHKIIQCHGVFDLLHPGHIRHFKRAKAEADTLIVTVTPDRFVNKGPGRPVFTEKLRLESLAALADIDYVVLNDSPDAVSAIKKIKPDLYVKGIEYAKASDDVTGKISDEVEAVESVGGKAFYTDDIVFSSSSLLNRFFDQKTPDVEAFLTRLKAAHSIDEIIQKIDALSSLKVLVVGDAIIDEYQYADPLGQSGKGHHMVVRSLEREVFLGGAFAIANHLAQFAGDVTLVTAIGRECPYSSYIHKNLDAKIKQEFTYLEETTTLIKKRYILKDGKTLSKLFETYSGHEEILNEGQTGRIVDFLRERASEFDLVLVCDFGNGFTNPALIDAISNIPTFLALNTQVNSGNRGFNVVTNYRKANFISLNELELRLATHDKTSSIEGLSSDISQIMQCPFVSVTRGVKGVFCFSNEEPSVHIPAFVTNSIDRIGAGDSYLSLSSLCMAKGYPILLGGFLGSLAAAMSVQMIGNQEPIKKASLTKFLIRLMK
jgi:rfaE bifunctional protein nucleotidyltransferase chain/domain